MNNIFFENQLVGMDVDPDPQIAPLAAVVIGSVIGSVSGSVAGAVVVYAIAE
ncbi:MAG: hypothetical protein LBL13_05225 [Bacteroidales bacterium]|jgi:hypothetical protein|nr:hypothetical protein [Bacteroidales bacterium]